jgi:hypothetical protein
MEWLVSPLDGFASGLLSGAAKDQCTGGATLNSCSCEGGLLSCACSGGLVIKQKAAEQNQQQG